jgi:hypothetical protein
VPRTKHPWDDSLDRIQRCWRRLFAALIAVGVLLGPLGVGRSRWALWEFLVIFIMVSVPLIARVLRPGVRLVSSMNEPGTLSDASPTAGKLAIVDPVANGATRHRRQILAED